MAARDGYELYALTVRYGQVHAREVEAARRVAAALRVERHIELDVDLAAFGGSALVGDGDIPKDRDVAAAHDIPATYVPARNTVFLSLALAWAEVVGATAIVIGVNALDYSGYPDCRPEYLEAFERMAATRHEGRRGRRATAHRRAAAAPVEGGDYRRGSGARPRLRPHPQLLRSAGRRHAMRALRQLPAACEGIPRSRPDRSGAALVTERLYYTDPYLTEFDALVIDVTRRRRPHRCRARSHRVLPDIRRSAVRYRNDWRRPRGRRRRWRRRRDCARRRGGGGGSRGSRLRASATADSRGSDLFQVASTGRGGSITCSSTPASTCCRRPSIASAACAPRASILAPTRRRSTSRAS